MRKRYLGILLVLALFVAGCGKKNTGETNAANEESAVNEENTTSKEDTKSENNAGKDKFDVGAEFLDLRIGDTVCVAVSGVEEPYQFKFTLNAVEYADGEINGYPAESGTEGAIVLDVTLEGVGPDVSYGIIFSQTYIGRHQFYTEDQADYGLSTFSNPDETISKGEKITGRIAIMWGKEDFVVEQSGVTSTKFAYTVQESEIKDYVSGEQ